MATGFVNQKLGRTRLNRMTDLSSVVPVASDGKAIAEDENHLKDCFLI